MTRNPLSFLVLALFLLTGIGCCPVTRLNISVALDKSFQDRYGMNREVTVDIVGVNPVANVRWQTYSMTSYWEAQDTMRNSLPKKTLTLNSSKLDPQVVTSDDPVWKDWLAGSADKDPPQIYVLVQIPKTFDKAKDDKPGSEDVRRQILTTKSCRWQAGPGGGAPTVKLMVDADRLSTLTAAKPE